MVICVAQTVIRSVKRKTTEPVKYAHAQLIYLNEFGRRKTQHLASFGRATDRNRERADKLVNDINEALRIHNLFDDDGEKIDLVKLVEFVNKRRKTNYKLRTKKMWAEE